MSEKIRHYCWECGAVVPGPHSDDCEHGRAIARLAASLTLAEQVERLADRVAALEARVNEKEPSA